MGTGQGADEVQRAPQRAVGFQQEFGIGCALGQREQAKRFFAMSLTPLVTDLGKRGVDPNACIEDVEILVDKLAPAVR